MLIDNFTYCISQLDKCIRAATCKVCVQPHSFVSADSCCGSFGEVKTLFCLETKAYLDEGVFVALQTFRLNLGRKRQKIPPVSRGGTSATQRQKFHTGHEDANQCLINPVAMGFQMQIYSILRFSCSILVKCCVHLRTSSSKTQMPVLEKTIFHKY